MRTFIMVINLHFLWIFILGIPIFIFIRIAVINQLNRFYLARDAGEGLSQNWNGKHSGKKSNQIDEFGFE